MRAGLDGKRAVRVRGLHRKRRGLDARFLRIGSVVDLDGVMVAFGPADIHPHKHFGEVGRIDAASSRADGDERIAFVVLARQQSADFECIDGLVDAPEFGFGFREAFGVAFFLGQFDEDFEILDALTQPGRPLELGL